MNNGVLNSEYAASPMPYGIGPASPLSMPSQFYHREAIDWQRRVIDNGGAVSASTLIAVSDFCRAIDRAGVRSRLFRLNLFCGTGLASCLVPLFRGPSFAGRQFGNATDTNANFVATDYTETGTTGGLVGNGSNKRLQTGLDLVAARIPHADSHCSWYQRAQNTSNASTIGSFGGGNVQPTFGALAQGQFNAIFFRSGGPSNCGIENATWSGANRSGHILCQRTGNDAKVYRNGADLNLPVTMTNTGSWGGHVDSTGVAITNPGAPSVFARNRSDLGNTGDQWLNATLQGYSIGLSMTAAQAASFASEMVAFQTALRRN